MKLLLIEDDPDHAELICSTLKDIDVELVCSGEEGLKRISEKSYDLILVDYRLPGMNGIEFLSKVSGIPVILLTGMGSEEIAVQALKHGAYDYIIKSLNLLQKLPLLIKQSIEKHRIKKEKELLEKNLSETKNYLDFIISTSADGIVVTDTNGRVVLFNKAMQELTGYTQEMVMGKVEGFYLGKIEGFYFDKEELKKINKDVEIYGKITNYRLRMLTKDKKFIHASVSESLLKDREGRATGSVRVYRDITKEVEIEHRLTKLYSELQQAHERLQELDKLKNNFLRITSHELRSPLTPIIGYLDMLSSTEMSEKQRKYIEIIERNALELNRLVGDLVEIIRIDSGRMRLERERVHIPGLIKEILENLNPMQKIIRNVADITIEIDRRKLSQVFSNLLSNAIKYTPENGEIRIEVLNRGKEIEASVSDTGIGIEEKDIPFIFERFYMADDPLTRKQGMRIGLFIAKSNVDLWGGKIWVESVRGRGSTFYFTIPK
ncbi:MAG: response regulator [Euryarchaeota archaeon]|nr:response regulator [Euryarchaeota archaeon]